MRYTVLVINVHILSKGIKVGWISHDFPFPGMSHVAPLAADCWLHTSACINCPAVTHGKILCHHPLSGPAKGLMVSSWSCAWLLPVFCPLPLPVPWQVCVLLCFWLWTLLHLPGLWLLPHWFWFSSVFPICPVADLDHLPNHFVTSLFPVVKPWTLV